MNQTHFPYRRAFSLFTLLFLLFGNFNFGASAGTSQSLLWKCSSGNGTVYLLGSIHFGKPEMYPLAPAIEDAFKQSQILYLEADTQAQDTTGLREKMMQLGQYTEGHSIAEDLSPNVLAQTRKTLNQMGLSIESFMMFRPWFIAFQLSALKLMQLGWSPEYGLDLYFTRLAHEQHKEIGEMEGVDFQMNLLSGLSKKEQELFLTYTLKTMDQAGERLGRLIPIWKNGDADALQKEIFSEELSDPELEPFYEKFFWQRNRAMSDKISLMLNEGRTVFIVVGAGHLIGPKGVVDLLLQKGVTIEQL